MPLGRTDLSKIETGTRKVSALELASIADTLDVRIEWFLDDAPSAVISRRNTRREDRTAGLLVRSRHQCRRRLIDPAHERGCRSRQRRLHVDRRRLTLAHELGHYLFADEFSVDWQIAGPTQSGRESKIDAFARAVLLPRVALEEMWNRHTKDERSIREAAVMTASAFRVDMSTLASRLIELRLVPRGVSQQIREVRTTKADIVDLELLGVSTTEQRSRRRTTTEWRSSDRRPHLPPSRLPRTIQL